VKRIAVTLQVKSDWHTEELVPVEWQAYQSETPGLVVCRPPIPVAAQKGAWVEYRQCWQVIHLGSGLPLGSLRQGFTTRKAALAMAKGLSIVADWRLSSNELVRLSSEAFKAGDSWPVKFQTIRAEVLSQ